MARKEREKFQVEIIEHLGVLKESETSDWCKAVARISWKGEPSTIDVRSLNLSQNQFGRGVTLTDDEADTLVNILVQNDYGSLEVLEEAVSKRKQRFTIAPPEPILEPVTIVVT